MMFNQVKFPLSPCKPQLVKGSCRRPKRPLKVLSMATSFPKFLKPNMAPKMAKYEVYRKYRPAHQTTNVTACTQIEGFRLSGGPHTHAIQNFDRRLRETLPLMYKSMLQQDTSSPEASKFLVPAFTYFPQFVAATCMLLCANTNDNFSLMGLSGICATFYPAPGLDFCLDITRPP